MPITKPNVLILGACGFVGRHLVDHLISNDLVAHIRAVDKTPPQMAWMNRRHAALFADDSRRVHFVSANLIDGASCDRAFGRIDGDGDIAWDIVINCAAETLPGRSDAIHADGTVRLSQNCARLSRAHQVRRYVELSSGCMHSNGGGGGGIGGLLASTSLSSSSKQTPANEESPIAPWTAEARHKAEVERRLRDDPELADLAYTVVRLPLVYGTGDRRGLTPRLVIAAIYKYVGDTMKLLWTADLRLITVHVRDSAADVWHLAQHGPAERQVYNVVDDAGTTQDTLSELCWPRC